MKNKRLQIFFLFLLFIPASAGIAASQPYAQPAAPKVALLLSPEAETVLVGSMFDIAVLLDTRGNSVNTIELNIKFPADKLEIIKPVKDKSLFSIWLEPPIYSNTEGTARLVGIITNGITTQSGVISTITFKAKNTGKAIVSVSPASKVLINDGLGTETEINLGRGTYTISPKPPGGIQVFSETHPYQDVWYNNNQASVSWDGEGLEGFSFILDNKPFTVPDDISDTQEVTKVYEGLGDGLWYFHVKAKKNGVWGGTTHFLLRVDTTPPAKFEPTLEFLTAAVINRTLVTFFTTDALSGLDHYEVAVIDKENAPTDAPVFIQSESPYQIPALVSGNLRIMVRAFDRAGNARDASIDTSMPVLFSKLSRDGLIWILIILFISVLLAHYLFGHKIIARFKKMINLLKKQELAEKTEGLGSKDKIINP